MIRIAFFQNDLGVGGIQKSLVNLLCNLDYNEFDVTLFLSTKENYWNQNLPKELKIVYLKKMPVKYKFLDFDYAMFTYGFDFDEDQFFDLAIDFNSYQPSCALGALTVPAKRRAMVIHNNVEIKYSEEFKYRVLFNAMKSKYKYFDVFLPCSDALETPFKKLTGIGADKDFIVINNYINVDEIHQKAEIEVSDIEVDNNKMNFIAVGKLCHQKGYDLMLRYFSEASKKRDDLHLYIIGDGPDKKKLELMAGNNVTFLGSKENPYSYMNLMDAFISTSRYEGQPLNIKEAEVIGLPIYCTKNLELYSDGLIGKEDIVSAIISAKKYIKSPDNLEEYNKRIINSYKSLAIS